MQQPQRNQRLFHPKALNPGSRVNKDHSFRWAKRLFSATQSTLLSRFGTRDFNMKYGLSTLSRTVFGQCDGNPGTVLHYGECRRIKYAVQKKRHEDETTASPF